MTGKKSILLVAMAATILSAGAARISLDSESGAKWQLCPQDDLAGVAGAAVSAPGFSMPGDAVAGVVPGVVFTAYVDAGKEQDPDYAVRSGIARSSTPPPTIVMAAACGLTSTTPTAMPISM